MFKSLLKGFILFLFVSFGLISCSSGCDEEQVAKDSEKIAEFATAYLADISNVEKCNDYVNAVEQFVADYRGCDDVDQTSIDSIEEAISALPCG